MPESKHSFFRKVFPYCKTILNQTKVISLVGNLVLLMAPHFAFPLVSQHGYQVIASKGLSKKIQAHKDNQPYVRDG